MPRHPTSRARKAQRAIASLVPARASVMEAVRRELRERERSEQ